MDQDALRKLLLGTFQGEVEEHVRALNAGLLALEKAPDPARRRRHLQELFRAVHSLKGAARSLGLDVIGAACHALEDLFAAMRERGDGVDPDTAQLLFGTVDAIADAGERLRAGEDLDRSDLAGLLPRLEAMAPHPPAARADADGDGESDADTNAQPAAPLPAAPVPAATEMPVDADRRSVRVAVEKLDALVSWSGEMLLARRRLDARQDEAARLQEAIRPCLDGWRSLGRHLRAGALDGSAIRERLDAFAGGLERIDRLAAALGANIRIDTLAIEQAAAPLDEAVRGTRMQPFASIRQGLERIVRDLARAQGKFVALRIEGGAVELDREVLDHLRDPLMHLVRNAVDHGIEPPADRRAAGKAEEAVIRIAASLASGRVEIVVEDDGRGLDLAAARARATAMNLEVASDDALPNLVFRPGFSTAPALTDISGRGIGLDVVKSRIEALRGSVEVAFWTGRGARFALAVPLTLGMLRALLVADGGTVYAIDDTAIVTLRRIGVADVRWIEGRQTLPLDGGHAPIVRLGDVLGATGGRPDGGDAKQPVVVVRAGEWRVALVVDELLSEQDITVKPLGPRLADLPHLIGASVLMDGDVALIVNPPSLIEAALASEPRAPPTGSGVPDDARRRIRLLLADDSVTVRTLEKSILETAGYDVVAVADGMAAWRLLQEVEIDLIVSDVEMPRMDGITLTERVRASPRLRALPVILVTGLKQEHDRMRGLEAGADAYVVKSAFDQAELLAVIERLTGVPAA